VASSSAADLLGAGHFSGRCAEQPQAGGSLAVVDPAGVVFASVLTELKREYGFLRYVSPFKYF